MILRCINQNNLCLALQDINPSNLCYLLSVIQSVYGGRSTTEYRRAVKHVCRLHSSYTLAQKLDDKTQVFTEFLHARKTYFSLWEKATVYPYNNINLQNPCDDM